MSKHADNVTMSEGGLYSLATRGAKDVIDLSSPRVLEAVARLQLDGTPPRFTMADMGCADGGTSLDLVRRVLGQVHDSHPGVASTVIYADQPANDYNALVSILHGRTAFDTWLGEFDNAYALFSGSSFYLQAVPDNSLDFVFSATAMHWLSNKPCEITTHVHMVGAEGEEHRQFAEQAGNDWQTILLNRAKELKPGGSMVLVNFCRDEQGRYLGNTGGVNMFDTFNDIWRQFVEAGRITEQEYWRMTLPQYYNTVEEFSAPLINPDHPCHQAGLRLESIETGIVRCPFALQFEQDGNVRQFADGLIPTIRSWNQSIFTAGLDSERDGNERKRLIEDYYQTYHQRVMEDPTGHGMDYVHAYMTITKA